MKASRLRPVLRPLVKRIRLGQILPRRLLVVVVVAEVFLAPDPVSSRKKAAFRCLFFCHAFDS